jgi:hypothetical protein
MEGIIGQPTQLRIVLRKNNSNLSSSQRFEQEQSNRFSRIIAVPERVVLLFAWRDQFRKKAV